MALRTSERSFGVRTLSELAQDEEGSAAAEFVILLPAYLAMLLGLFALGQLSLAFQALPCATRIETWWAPANGVDGLFAAYGGTYQGAGIMRSDSAGNMGGVGLDEDIGNTTEEDMLSALLRNSLTPFPGSNLGSTDPIVLRAGTSTFSYSGPMAQTWGPFTMSMQGKVFIWNQPRYIEHQQIPVPRDMGRDHPFAQFGADELQGSSGRGFDTLEDGKRYLSRRINPRARNFRGLWDRNQRLGRGGGGPFMFEQEHQLYEGEM